MDHPVCTHMSTSIYVHLQFITFTCLILYLKLFKKILTLSNDQWNSTLFAILKHSYLDFAVAVFRLRDVFNSPGISFFFPIWGKTFLEGNYDQSREGRPGEWRQILQGAVVRTECAWPREDNDWGVGKGEGSICMSLKDCKIEGTPEV